MSHIGCPHCGKDIELIGVADIKEKFGWGPNKIAALRSKGVFPTPALGGPSPQKFYWLAGDLEIFAAKEVDERIAKYVEELQHTIESRSEEEQELIRKRLAAELDGK